MENALVILCGGNSTRMGTDKALLPFGDTCLIEYLVRKFQPYFSRIYLSVKIKGDYSHLKLPVTEIPDIYPNQGPMSGIFSGLSMIDEECAFFMSVDRLKYEAHDNNCLWCPDYSTGYRSVSVHPRRSHPQSRIWCCIFPAAC